MRIMSLALCAALAASAARADGLSPERYADAESLAMICSELAVMSQCYVRSPSFPNMASARGDFLRKLRPVGLSDSQMERLDLAYQRGELTAMQRSNCRPGQLDGPDAAPSRDAVESSLATTCRP